jgi:cell wall-associated NlpC family hydrolase
VTILDKRLHAFRADLADIRLKGQVESERFVPGRPARIAAPLVDMRGEPRPDAGLSTQLLHGEDVTVFEERDGWAWIQSERDSYVGYVPAGEVKPRDGAPTHKVCVPRTFLYPAPDMKLPRLGALSMATELVVVGSAQTRGTSYALLQSGEAIIARHLMPASDHAADYVAVAEALIDTPYLWGGVSAFGLDCSGLVQLAMRMAGRSVLRDSDMQASGLGEAFQPEPDYSNLRRGDLVFWKGHVAIMTNAGTMIHANGHTMLVSREPLREAINRIGYLYGGPTLFRRP